MTDMLIVMTTVSDLSEAESLAAKIVEAGLAACVQVFPQMTSFYMWKGEMKNEPEHLLLIKTLAAKYDALEALITADHSYSVPEIISIEAAHVSGPYLDWMTGLLI